MKLSVSIMAHPKRREWAESLSRQLGNAPIAWDTDNTIWNTCKKAWKKHTKSDYHLVIQDDAVLCKDFLEKTTKFIEKIKSEKGYTAFQLFFGERKSILASDEIISVRQQGYIERHALAWGVAICMPTKWIDEMIRFGDKHTQTKNDDTKIKNFLISKKVKTIFPIPCFVDHRPMKENPSIVSDVDSNRVAQYFIDREPEPFEYLKIPKKIHQIWIGNEHLPPQKMMDTWNIQGWEYNLWTEKEIKSFGLTNKKLYNYFIQKKCWYGASDVARIEIVNRLGGFYIDADTERTSSLDDLLDNSFVSAFSNTEGRIANGIFGSIPNHPILEAYIEEMGKAEKVEPVWSTIGGTLFTECINKHKTNRTKLLKPISFYPFDSKGRVTRGRGKNYGRHHWFSTHHKYEKI